MSFMSSTDGSPRLTINLEILAEDASDLDLALTSAVGRDTIDELQHDGYIVQPVSTGQRGGEILVEVITTLTTIAAHAWAHKETFERVINDTGALVTVCGGIVPIAKTLLQAFGKRTASSSNAPIKMTLEIDGAPISVEAADLEQAEAALTLAQKFYASHPASAQKVTAASKVKLKGCVPKVPQRKRR